MRLLTDEEIYKVARKAFKDDGHLALAVNRGHWEDIAPVIAEAQARVTREEFAKEVGAWLETKIGNILEMHGRTRDVPELFELTFYAGELESFQRGELPK